MPIQRLAERGAHGLNEDTRQDLAQLTCQIEKVGMITLAHLNNCCDRSKSDSSLT
ncbi:MAG: hypothetical protein HC873_00320 [Leptolyngbyaceae cyanobacterium SL_1_1]|nr:hypothetical protein [Leptolyngbyaceae cyanobacterium SL_1_1]